MQTIKTAVVVVLLLGVCYGAYVALNAPEPTLPDSLQDWNEEALALNVENGAAVDIPQLSQTPPPDALDSLAPPSVTPPAQAGPTTPTLQLPPRLSADTKPTKTPDIIAPPAVDASTNKLDGTLAGNELPNLPELSLPGPKEGDAVPLPDAPEPKSSLPPTPASLASMPTAPSEPALPPPPSFPGQEETTSKPAAETLPASPGLLTASGSTGITMPSANTKTDPNSKPASATSQPFSMARDQALKLAGDGKLREALALMSPYFNHIELTHQEHLDLVDLLDALAGEVIYSRRHLLEGKFVVSAGDTLESIANKYRISPEALANINRMGDSRVVLAGTELKVLTGPFRGEVDLSKGELTLFLGELYAGRFPVSFGKEPVPTEGAYSIVGRRRDQSYVGPDSKYIPANDARNPYGGYWMHLGNNLCIHGSPEVSTPESEAAGCISLAPLDAKEVYSLLTQGSEVVIKR